MLPPQSLMTSAVYLMEFMPTAMGAVLHKRDGVVRVENSFLMQDIFPLLLQATS